MTLVRTNRLTIGDVVSVSHRHEGDVATIEGITYLSAHWTDLTLKFHRSGKSATIRARDTQLWGKD